MSEKIVKVIVAVILIYVIAQICWVILCDPYTPKLNPNERWVSQDPDISIICFDEEKGRPCGEMRVNGETIEILPLFRYGGYLYILNWPTIKPDCTQDADRIMWGECVFHKDWFVVKIKFDRDGFFEGIRTITFRKEYIDTEGQTDPQSGA